jgi:hypothetical protein
MLQGRDLGLPPIYVTNSAYSQEIVNRHTRAWKENGVVKREETSGVFIPKFAQCPYSKSAVYPMVDNDANVVVERDDQL